MTSKTTAKRFVGRLDYAEVINSMTVNNTHLGITYQPRRTNTESIEFQLPFCLSIGLDPGRDDNDDDADHVFRLTVPAFEENLCQSKKTAETLKTHSKLDENFLFSNCADLYVFICQSGEIHIESVCTVGMSHCTMFWFGF